MPISSLNFLSVLFFFSFAFSLAFPPSTQPSFHLSLQLSPSPPSANFSMLHGKKCHMSSVSFTKYCINFFVFFYQIPIMVFLTIKQDMTCAYVDLNRPVLTNNIITFTPQSVLSSDVLHLRPRSISPKTPWLQARWLEFIHFGERHFTGNHHLKKGAKTGSKPRSR